MSRQRSVKFLLCLLFLVLGGRLLSRSSLPAPEPDRVPALLAVYAPAGSSIISHGHLPQSEIPTDFSYSPVSPTTVNLADIPPNQYDPRNQYDLWHSGVIDLADASLYSDEQLAALQQAAQNLPVSAAIDMADGPGDQAPSPLIGFDSIDYTECCGGGGNVPPDPELAVGPSHVVAVVNVALEIYDKSGNTILGPTTFASFMSANPNCPPASAARGVFDPNALYDEEADRYMVGIDASGSFYCIAVSATSDPTGLWHVYAIPTPTPASLFFDYPHAGVGQDAIYMGGNMFDCLISCDFLIIGFSHSRIWAFDKAQMYAGAALSNIATAQLSTTQATPQPLNLHGFASGTWPSGGPHYFLTSGATIDDLVVNSWTNPFDGSNGTIGVLSSIDLLAATGVSVGIPVDVPQATGDDVQANDTRPQDFEYRNGFGWTTMAVSCNPGSGSVNCVRWAQIDLSDGSVADAGVYASDGEYLFFPDLAVDDCGNMAVGYSKSSPSLYPGIYYTGRQVGDPAGTLQVEDTLRLGEIEYTSFETTPPRRFGDYTEMTIDPNGTTFWYLGEYSKDTGTTDGRWGTYVGAVEYPCSPTALTSTSVSVGDTQQISPFFIVVMIVLSLATARKFPKRIDLTQ